MNKKMTNKCPQAEKACKIRKNFPINMKIPGAYFQIMKNKYKKFQKNPCTNFLEYAL